MSNMIETEHRGTILIVDDIPANLEVLLDMLNGQGYELLTAIDGESAIRQAEYARPDILLLDVMMPGIDGFEICRRLKAAETTRDIPVIFLTALSETVDKVRGFELGAVGYITKPLQYEEVVARVRTHLTVRNLQRKLQEMNDVLEQRVVERTAELAEANTRLRAEIDERKNAEERLRQAHRLLERRVSELDGRDRLTHLQLAGPTLRQACEGILQVIGQVLEVDKAILYRRESTAGDLQPVAVLGLSEPGRVDCCGQVPDLGAAQTEKHRRLIAQTFQGQRPLGVGDREAVTPIVYREEMVGGIWVDGLEEEPELMSAFWRLGREGALVLRAAQITEDMLDGRVSPQELMELE